MQLRAANRQSASAGPDLPDQTRSTKHEILSINPHSNLSHDVNSKQHFIGIDIGGSSIKVGVVSGEGHIVAKQASPAYIDAGREAGLEILFDTVERAVDESGLGWEQIAAIGVAAPGTMDIPAGIVFHPFNLPGWENLPIRDIVAERVGRPAILQNDANAAAYGEYWVGTAREAGSLMFWTLGTGIGGGIVIDGRILEGAHSHGGECGHIIIQMDGGVPSEHGIHGSLELYAGAKALLRRCDAALAEGKQSLIRGRLAEGEELSPMLIADCAEQGDELAESLVMETARYMAIGTVNIMHTLNPEMVLFGGAMTFGQHETALGRKFLAKVREEVSCRTFPILRERTRIDYASLGNDAGIIGAAGCAMASLKNS